ncbi:MAG: PQQ-binding-like beta-propeller repeat protein, partial [bacterium]
MNACKMRLIIVSVLMLLTQSLWSQEWPQWRGPERDGHLKAFSAPATWPDSLKKVWSIETGAGLSSPVVSDGKIYLLTRDGDDEVVSCYQIADGRRIWQQRYATPFIPNPQAVITRFFPASKGKGPFATPVVHRNRLYTLGVDRVLSCFDAKTGDLKWRHHELKQEIPDKVVYECPPCGCNVDGKEFDQPGKCPACNMDYGPKGLE